MSTHVNSLKKQIELLQGEVETYANAVDNLAGQLAAAHNQLQLHGQPIGVDISQMVPANELEKKAAAEA